MICAKISAFALSFAFDCQISLLSLPWEKHLVTCYLFILLLFLLKKWRHCLLFHLVFMFQRKTITRSNNLLICLTPQINGYFLFKTLCQWIDASGSVFWMQRRFLIRNTLAVLKLSTKSGFNTELRSGKSEVSQVNHILLVYLLMTFFIQLSAAGCQERWSVKWDAF